MCGVDSRVQRKAYYGYTCQLHAALPRLPSHARGSKARRMGWWKRWEQKREDCAYLLSGTGRASDLGGADGLGRALRNTGACCYILRPLAANHP